MLEMEVDIGILDVMLFGWVMARRARGASASELFGNRRT